MKLLRLLKNFPASRGSGYAVRIGAADPSSCFHGGYQPPHRASGAPPRSLRLLACPLIILSSLPGEELLVRDLRLGLGTSPTSFTYTLSDQLATSTGKDALDSAYAASLRLSWSWSGAGRSWAPILAAEVLTERATYGSDGRYQQYALRGLAGFGWQASDAWSFSAQALLGVGRPSFTVPVAGRTTSTAGASASTGILLGMRYALNRTWSLDIEGGWIKEAAILSGDGEDLDLTRSGACISLGVRWAWSQRPVRLP